MKDGVEHFMSFSLHVRANPKSPKADGLACPAIDGYNDHKKSTERKMPLKDARFAG